MATVLVLRSIQSHSSPAPAPAPTAAHVSSAHPKSPANVRRFYIVRSGDTLSAIAARTGVSVATLESLNPSVDPAAQQTGQRLKLR